MNRHFSRPALFLAAWLLLGVSPPEVWGQSASLPPASSPAAIPPPAIAPTAPEPAQVNTQQANAAQVNAQEPNGPELPTAEAVQTQIEAVTADEALDEATATRLLNTLRSTLEHLRNLQENRQREAALKVAAQTAPQRIAAARELLQQDLPPPTLPPPVLPPEASVRAAPLPIELYQQRRAEAEMALNAARQELQNLETTRRERRSRSAVLPMLIADARDAVDQAASLSIGPLDADSQGTLRAARENERLASLAAARLRLAALLAEQAMIDAEAELLTLQIELAREAIQRAEESLRLWTEALGRQKQVRIENELDRYRRELADSGTDLQRSVALKLGDSWIDLVSSNAATRRSLVSQRSRFDELDSTLKQARAEIERDLESPDGLRSGLGLKLQRIRARLPSSAELRNEIRAVDQSIEQTRQLQTTIDLALEDIGGGPIGGLMLGPDVRPPMDNGNVNPQEVSLLKQIGSDADSHITDLIELKGGLELNRRKLEELRGLIARNVVWIRDAAPLRPANLSTAWWTLRWVVDPSHFSAAGSALILAVFQRGDLVAIWIALVLIPWCLRPRLQRRLRSLNEAAQLPAPRPLLATSGALLITLLAAIAVPATLAVLGMAILHTAGKDGFLQAFGAALLSAAAVILPMRWLRRIFRTGGLAEAHFRYPPEVTRPANAALGKMLWMSVPFVVLWGLASSPVVARTDDSLGRIVFVIAMMLLAAIFWRALDPESGVVAQYLREYPDGWAAKLRYVWRGFSLLPLIFAGFAFSGYTFAATLLAERLYWSLWFFIALLVLGGLLTRWVQVRRTNRLISGDPSTHLPTAAAADKGVEPTVEPAVGYAAVEIDVQTLRLLRALLWVTVLVGVAWLWAPVLPAVRFLDRVPLWDTTAVDGAIVPVTLAHLVTALPIIFLAWVAARNVPGLIEIALLERLPLDKPARYAITSLASYAIVIIGIMLTARTVGLRWEGIQWLVAALGVGLGFGLQEIFANFVSGLILLFEQPIRVGDVVTIGETTGTVSQIRMRATIVTNWDRQELIIPNKNLITERIINWTLSDSTNRIELRVGVAYGSDVPLACRLLEEICHQQENVLVDPAPIITFDQFGDSALNITVRCFLGKLDQRLSTTHALNVIINQRFKEAGIEIAFPQQDLHIRSLPPDWPRGRDSERDSERDANPAAATAPRVAQPLLATPPTATGTEP